MIYIWLDESDKKGSYYSNFYGGILMDSRKYDFVLKEATNLLTELGIENEIKWQNVNAYTFDRYVRIVDYIFDLLERGDAKIRIFFRNNQYKAIGLTKAHQANEFTILYYEFIKHGFGLRYCDMPLDERFVRLYIDDIPARGSQVAEFRRFILGLNYDRIFKSNHVHIRDNDIIEVDSEKHLPLQFLDLILGAMCFRLNDKHRIKDPQTGKRGKRTILKEKLYKHIYGRISVLRPHFNIGESTGIIDYRDRWRYPYSHWSFKPASSVRDYSEAKP